jgi:hypothetical protein
MSVQAAERRQTATLLLYAQGSNAPAALKVIEPLLRFVHLSSEREVEPVRQDSSFAEKQKSHPALPLIVHSGRWF